MCIAPPTDELLQPTLATSTPLPIVPVENGVLLRPDHVFVVPTGAKVRLVGGRFQVAVREQDRRHAHELDDLLSALAKVYGARVIGVVFSGSLDDGVAGCKAVRRAGGLVAVQDPADAAHPSLPKAALAARVANMVQSPVNMGYAVREQGNIARAGSRRFAASPRPPPAAVDPREETTSRRAPPESDPQASGDATVVQILEEVRRVTGLDFQWYKRGTVQRRIERRALATRSQDVHEYLSRVRAEPGEAQTLAGEFLIPVTGFFREPESFEALAKKALVSLFESGDTSRPLRVWVPACSSGEEAYSLGILLEECRRAHGIRRGFHVFATDLSPAAIDIARRGTYGPPISDVLSQDRLVRFFQPVGEGHRIDRSLRSRFVFSVHDVAGDPPFSKIDIVSCRNLLIYMAPALQRRVLEMFHYSLREQGVLILGAAEGVSAAPALFERLEGDTPVFRRAPGPAAMPRRDVPTTSVPFAMHAPAESLAHALVPGPALSDSNRPPFAQVGAPSLVVANDGAILASYGAVEQVMGPLQGRGPPNVFDTANTPFAEAVQKGIAGAHRRGRAISVPIEGNRDRGPGPKMLDVVPLTVQARVAFLIVIRSPDSEARRRSGAAGRPMGGPAPSWRRFRGRRAVERLFNLIPTDVGRPISDIKGALEVPDLKHLVLQVIESVSVKEIEVQDDKGRWYALRIHPYLTMEKKIDGAVVVVMDITGLRKERSATEVAQET